jgi:glycosyltransferase involved in cell wall biosynthesis
MMNLKKNNVTKKHKVGFLSKEPPTHASVYMRVKAPLTYLLDKDNIKYVDLGGYVREKHYSLNYKNFSQVDVIIIHKRMALLIPYNILIKAFGMYRPKIIYDIDDALTMRAKSNQGHKSYNKSKLQIEEYLRNADLVTVSTAKLKSFYSSFNNNITVLPNCLDMRLWSSKVESKKDDGIVRILFSGTNSHASDLQLIENAIIKIANEFGNKVRFLLWGNTSKRLIKYSQVRKIQEFLPDYIEYINRLKNTNVDFAIIPLEDNPFNQAKSHIKWLEYSICKIPGIYSNIGAYSEFIENKKTGVLVDNTCNAWYKTIREFIVNSDYLKTIRQNAYEEVLKNHTLDKNTNIWLEAYSNLFASSGAIKKTADIYVNKEHIATQDSKIQEYRYTHRITASHLLKYDIPFVIGITGKANCYSTKCIATVIYYFTRYVVRNITRTLLRLWKKFNTYKAL